MLLCPSHEGDRLLLVVKEPRERGGGSGSREAQADHGCSLLGG